MVAPPATAAPRVAVVIPCHDDGRTLRDTLGSLQEQEPHELVVVDDGSTDPGTLEFLADLRVEGVTVIRQDNAGPGAARMTGARATKAPYVFPLDADDAAAPGALAALADALDANPAAAAAWGDETTFGRVELHFRSPDHLDPWLVTYVNELPVIALMRREALFDAGGWQLRSGYEDWDLWMALAERGCQGVHVPRVVALHRVHGSRRSHANRSQHHAIYTELRTRHPALYAERRANWRRTRAPLRARVLLPLIESLPIASSHQRYLLGHLVMHPVRLLRARVGRG